MVNNELRMFLAKFGFTEYETKGFGGVRVYRNNNGVLFTGFLLTNEGYLAYPLQGSITVQTPQFNFEKGNNFADYLKEINEALQRLRITKSSNDYERWS